MLTAHAVVTEREGVSPHLEAVDRRSIIDGVTRLDLRVVLRPPLLFGARPTRAVLAERRRLTIDMR